MAKLNPLEMLKEMQNKLIETIEEIEGFTAEHKKYVADKAERVIQEQQLNKMQAELKQHSKDQKKAFTLMRQLEQ